MMGHLHAMNVYHHALHFFPAKYHGDFDSPDAVRAAAVADGFAAFDNERWKEERNKYTIIYHWGYACILRQVVDDNKNALVMIDDRVLRLEFPHLVNIVGVLEKDHPPFYFLQLEWWLPPSGAEWMMALGVRDERYKDLDLVNGFIAKGTGGFGDFATVFSPAGAQIFLDYLDTPSAVSFEYYFGQLADPDRDKTGIFHFIHPMAKIAPVQWEQDSIRRWEIDVEQNTA